MMVSKTPHDGCTITANFPDTGDGAANSIRCRRFGRSALWVLCLLAAFGCRSGGADRTSAAWTARHSEELRQAGERLGVPVRTAGMVELSTGDTSLFAGPADNLGAIPTSSPTGVDFGVAYVNLTNPVAAQGSSTVLIPKGYYRLRAFTEELRKTGASHGHGQLIDAAGSVAADLPAESFPSPFPTPAGGGETVFMIRTSNNSTLICGEMNSDGFVFCLRFTQARAGQLNGISVTRG
jgi:hypothetical protein